MESLELLALIPLGPSRAEPYRYELARTYYFLGRRPGRETGPGPPEPPGGPERPGDHRLGLPPPEPPARDDAQEPRSGPPPPDAGRREREGYLNKAAAILETLVEQQPVLPDYRLLLARCYRELAPGPAGAERPAPDPLDKAIDVLQKLAVDYPDVPDYRYELCETLATTRFQGPRFVPEEHPTAEQRLRTALQISQELAREHPNIPEYAAAQVHVLHKLAHVLRETERSQEAEASLRNALELQSSLVRQFPDVASHRVWRAVVQESLADLLRERGELHEARSLVEDAIATWNDCLGREWNPDFANLLARNYEKLANILTRLGERELAETARRKARGLAFGEGPPKSPKR